MKLLLPLLLLAAAPAPAQTPAQTAPAPPTFYSLRRQSQAAYDAKRYREAGQLFDRALKRRPAQPSGSDYYNAACDWALAGEADKAFAYLDKATAAGWDNIAHTREDSDLNSLHADGRWLPLLAHMQAAVARAEARQNPVLKRELAEIFARDQGTRRRAADLDRRLGPKAPGLDSLWAQVERDDTRNLTRVTAMINQYGWPGRSLVGQQGSTTAFLVIQHSDLPTMQRYLPLMRQAAARGELENSNLALLEDRVRVYQDQPQLYGSQVRRNATTGQMELAPIQDEARVDERRARMGLGPLADYAKGFGIEYGVPAKP